MPAENEKKTAQHVTERISERIERAEIKITYKGENAEQPLPSEDDFMRNIRRDIAQRLNEFVEQADVESIEINFKFGDN